jgi:hypothetical protein
MKQQITAVKITAGQYRLGNLIVTKHLPEHPGHVVTWCRSDDQGGGMLGYTIAEVVELANKPMSYAYDLANGTKLHPASK